jgi:hypothetical protein
MSLLPGSALRMVDQAVDYYVKTGVGSPWRVGSGVVVLEMTGAKSGKRRHVPVAGARWGNHLVISTVRSGSHWLRNVEADPSVQVWLGGRRRTATATVNRGPLNIVTLELTDEPGAPAAEPRVSA